jgi:DNA-binding GntR family transcriptional regulator
MNSKDNKQDKLSAKAFEFVISQIVEGTFAPSSKISPKEIADQLAMSMAPVRDAMEQLEKDGWIVRYPQSGTYVRQITVKDIEEIYELREIIETGAVRFAVQRATQDDLASLKETAHLLMQASQSDDLKTYEKLDTQFHMKLIKITRNASLIKTLESVLFKTRSFFIAMKATSYGQKSSANMEEVPVSHMRIYEAIASQQADRAEQLIRRHVAISCEWNKAQVKIQELSQS